LYGPDSLSVFEIRCETISPKNPRYNRIMFNVAVKPKLATYLENNFEEIRRDRSLRIYGAMMAFLHVLAFLHWELLHPLAKILDPRLGPAVCWPFFEDCYKWRVLSPSGVERVLWGYCLFAVITITLFSKRKWVPIAWWALLALNLFKSFILFQDYRLRLNQHYMTYWVTLAFLFVPHKRRVITYLVASFYFWAGTLKFTPEWVSGAALYGRAPLGVPQSLIPASCIYVIFLELIVSFGLLVRNRWIFWCSLTQFVVFHIASWPIVQFFYPMLMLSILTIFPLARFIQDPSRPEAQPPLAVDLRGFFRGKEVRGAYALVIIFGLFQIVPFVFPGDQSFTGEGRLFALHMFDAPLECVASATARDPTGRKRTLRLSVPLLPVRIRCDPVVYFSVAKNLCSRLSKRYPLATLDLHLKTRRSGEHQFRQVIDQSDFCHAGLSYDLWRPNVWILSSR